MLLRQTFGSLPSTQDGLISVGVVDGKVAYVSSSSAGDGAAPGGATLSPAAAWVAAANDAGRSVSVANVLYAKVDATTGWTGLKVNGFDQYQRARLVALPTYTEGVRPAYETIVLDTSGAWPTAYRSFVDAQTGKVWLRQNQVDALADAARSPRTVTATATTAATTTCDPSGLNCAYADSLAVGATVECGPFEGPYNAPAGTKSIDDVATTDIAANDIILKLYYAVAAETPSPARTRSPARRRSTTSPASSHRGTTTCGCARSRQSRATTCRRTRTTARSRSTPRPAPAAPAATTPKWKVFEANPPLDYSTNDSRVIDCWLSSLAARAPADAECQRAVANIASRAPWDFDVQANTSTFTTRGNNANTAEAWGSPLTPGGAEQRPVESNRRYVEPWDERLVHEQVRSRPSSLRAATTSSPPSRTCSSATTGCTTSPTTSASPRRTSTRSRTTSATRLRGRTRRARVRPGVGNVQAGAVSGGAPSYHGRDNANQITLNDGIPPITNQYLFQPIAAAFYAPCVDGDMDTSVFGHEYTHLISNRMVGGPDSGLTGSRPARWASRGPISTRSSTCTRTATSRRTARTRCGRRRTRPGNKEKGIRDYALNSNPLNYSDIGFDTAGPEVHADGEVWNGVNYDIRQALVDKYNATFPASDGARQQACAAASTPPTRARVTGAGSRSCTTRGC